MLSLTLYAIRLPVFIPRGFGNSLVEMHHRFFIVSRKWHWDLSSLAEIHSPVVHFSSGRTCCVVVIRESSTPSSFDQVLDYTYCSDTLDPKDFPFDSAKHWPPLR